MTHSSGTVATDGQVAPTETNLLRTLTPVLAGWRVVLGLPLVFGLITAIITLFVRSKYTAVASFVPETSQDTQLPSGLAGIIGQLGINLPLGGSLSGDFFGEVLTSRELLTATLTSTFRDSTRGGPVRDTTLLAILDPRGRTERERIENAIRDFRDDVSVKVDRRSGLISLNVSGRPSQLVADVANRMLVLLNEFNLKRRQSRSAAQRRFVGERLDVAEQELRKAEDTQLRFLTDNRRYRDSPLLSFEAERLALVVSLRQEIFQTLSREFEQARIAEVRDTPLLTVVDRAVAPVRRSSPKRVLLVVLAMLGGLCVALTAVFVQEYRKAVSQQDADGYGEFAAAWADFRRSSRLRRLPADR